MAERHIPDDRRQMIDRRDTPRQPLHTQLRLLRSGAAAGEVLYGELSDVSSSGLRFVLDEPLELSENLVIEIRDPDDNCVNLIAKVVWVQTQPDAQHRIGCELPVELSPRLQVHLRQLLHEAHASQV